MTANFGWTNPVLGDNAANIYGGLYGETGRNFISVLEDCPYEVAILSRLTAYLKFQRRG